MGIREKLRHAFRQHYRMVVYIRREVQETNAFARVISCWGYVKAIDSESVAIGDKYIRFSVIARVKPLKEHKSDGYKRMSR